MISKIIMSLQTQVPVSTSAERYLLIYMIGVLIIVSALIIIFFIVFQKRKNKLLMEKMKQQREFEEEISKTQLEIQEQTLKDIGQELHDNIGQLLSVANMHLSILSTEVPDTVKERFSETKDVVKQGLGEVRALSKSLNSDDIKYRGIKEALNNEINRLNRLKLINAKLVIVGNEDEKRIADKDSIVLFRILQEFFSNTIKYSDASSLQVKLDYKEDKLLILAKDDGKGFDMDTTIKGSGLINMESRAKLINTKFSISSNPQEGVSLTLEYPFKTL